MTKSSGSVHKAKLVIVLAETGVYRIVSEDPALIGLAVDIVDTQSIEGRGIQIEYKDGTRGQCTKIRDRVRRQDFTLIF